MASDIGTKWPMLPLREIALKIQDGTHFSPKMGGHDYRYVTSRNIGAGYLKLQNVEMISEAEHRKIYGRCDVKYGDLLLTKDGANTGNAAISTFREEVSLLSSVAFVRCDPRKATEAYLLQYLLSEVGNRQITDAMSGNAITRLTLSKINALTLPVPHVSEQREIAAVLSAVDALVYSLERLIAKKQAIKQGMMQQLLSGKTRLPGFNDAWASERLGDIAAMRSGGTPDSKNLAYYGGGIPWASISDMTSGGRYLASTEKTLSQRGLDASAAAVYPSDAVLFAMYASIGECSLAVGSVASSQAILGITPGKRLSREFLYYILTFMRPLFREMGQQGTQSNLNAGMVRRFQIMLPGSREQKAIVDALSDSDAEIDALHTRLRDTRAIKQGMMQELLTGRIRLDTAKATV